MLNKKKKKGIGKKGDLIFYIVMMAFPVLQFCVFYIGCNANSIIMSFQNISYVNPANYSESNVEITWTLQKYADAFAWFGSEEFKTLLLHSLLSFVITASVSVPLGLLFAYYIFKKLPGWSGFRVILFLPMILSGVVTASIFRYFLDQALPRLIESMMGLEYKSVDSLLSSTGNSSFAVLMFYNIFVGFGVSVLMYANKMSGISPEIVEAAHLDGATGIKEFWHIILPYTFPTISVFLVTAVAQICVNQYGVFDMFAGNLSDQSLNNIGYWFFAKVTGKFNGGQGLPELPYYSAIGVIFTLFTVPVTLLVRWLFEKYGPSER